MSVIPELNILSFSYLNGIIANEINPLSASLHISEITGAIAEPAFPARLLISIIVEYCEILDLISSDIL